MTHDVILITGSLAVEAYENGERKLRDLNRLGPVFVRKFFTAEARDGYLIAVDDLEYGVDVIALTDRVKFAELNWEGYA